MAHIDAILCVCVLLNTFSNDKKNNNKDYKLDHTDWALIFCQKK